MSPSDTAVYIFLCSSVVDGLIDKVNILHEFITSDHKPVFVTFRGMKGSLQTPTTPQQGSIPIMDWFKADAHCMNSYQTVLAMWTFLLIYCMKMILNPYHR